MFLDILSFNEFVVEGTEFIETTEVQQEINVTVNQIDYSDTLQHISDCFDQLLAKLDSFNLAIEDVKAFLFRLCDISDLGIALIVTIALCVLYYKVLEYYWKF